MLIEGVATFLLQRPALSSPLKARARRVKEVLANPKYGDAWTPYPFNSGYFMCLRLRGVNAERVRVRLYRSPAEIEHTILAIGSHDITLDVIAQFLAARNRRLRQRHRRAAPAFRWVCQRLR